MGIDNVLVEIRPGNEGSLWFLLQKGFWIESVAGLTVREFLRTGLGYGDDFIDSTVRTIFLNSSPVDDIDTAHVSDGDVVALGSAMPGLVGICMGRDTLVSGFRSDISYVETRRNANHASATVRTKVFSTLAAQTGLELLDRGIIMDSDELHTFLASRRDKVISINGGPVDQALAELSGGRGRVLLRVKGGC